MLEPGEKGEVKLGCAEYGFRELPMDERLRVASRLGFRVVEFGIGDRFPSQLTETPTAQDLETFRRAHAELGLEPWSAVIAADLALADADAARLAVERCRRLIGEIAVECGASRVCIAPTATPVEEMDEARWDRLLDSLARCEETATVNGLAIGLETLGRVEVVSGQTLHRHTVMTSAAPLTRLLAEAPARIGIVWDIGNVKAVEPAEPEYLYPVIKDRIVASHLKDWSWTDEDGWRTVGVGDDDIDYPALYPRLAIDGVNLIEYENPEDVEAGTKRSLDLMLGLGARIA